MSHLLLRDSFWGRTIYHLSKHRYFSFPEEKDGFIAPEKYYLNMDQVSIHAESEKNIVEGLVDTSNSSLEEVKTTRVIVDWDEYDQKENPQNWSSLLKCLVVFEVGILTVAVYMGSAIYTPGIEDIMRELNVSRTVATLPLTLFVIGYAVGPMIFSPMSEHPAIGRTTIYVWTLFIFAILQIPTALTTNIAGFCILRFIGGFFASPALATGPASVGDVIAIPHLPVGLGLWSICAVCGPSLGPLFGAIFSQLVSWRWCFWFLLITSGTLFIVLGFTLPETYVPTLLYRKARRLRALTKNELIISKGELDIQDRTAKEVLIECFWRPVDISFRDPVVLMINFYISMVYSIWYIWFEAFPIVFLEVYGFSLIGMGASFAGILIGVLICSACYCYACHVTFARRIIANETIHPEFFVPGAIIGGCIMPTGIFILGWTATKSVHWIVPIIGSGLFAAGGYLIFQTLFNYLAMSFPRYMASAFAGNDLFRSFSASVFPLFGHALYANLGSEKFPVGWGSSVLGFITVAMIAIPVTFMRYGPRLRANSRYAGP
ncbi:hypothetical protein LJB42_001968 [Komagataella kurtzmanii]|nr:hypothetical protein LJB42_001968 [Komagataella kurtzmanii]